MIIAQSFHAPKRVLLFVKFTLSLQETSFFKKSKANLKKEETRFTKPGRLSIRLFSTKRPTASDSNDPVYIG